MCLEQQVTQFNQVYAIPSYTHPTLPPLDEMKLMGDLILEELQELANAYVAKDKVEFFDAILDILYATAQQAVRLGYPVAEGLQEVHRSNMSKLGQDGKPIFSKEGKVLKGPNYIPPNLKVILEKFTNV